MKRKLSVLILSPHPQTQGGIASYAEMLKKYLRQCNVTSFWVGAPPQSKENIFQLICRLIVVPPHIAWLVHRESFDIVHINSSLDKKSLLRDGLIILALVLIGYRRMLLFFHGWDNRMSNLIARNILLRKIFVLFLSRSARILVLAPEFRAELIKMGVDTERTTVMRTMVELHPTPRESSVQRHHILFLSRFDRRKGIYELLEAFASIANEFPDYDLVMAGEGVEKALLQRRVKELALQNRVSFPGYVTGDAKMDLLQQCTLFALPTYYPEGMPIAVLEAMAEGKPLLVTKAGGLKHIVSDPENGVVLQTVSTDSVAIGLRRLLSDVTFCAEAGQRNAVAACHFEASTVTAEIESIYNDIARMNHNE